MSRLFGGLKDHDALVRVWRTKHEHTTGWHLDLRTWRVQLSWTVLRHRGHGSSDRWVLQSSHVYDRKAVVA